MSKIKVLVVGSKGQLGSEIQYLAAAYHEINFNFMDSKTLDITNAKDVLDFFKDNSFDYCINCAGYTDVEKAEEERETAYKVNVDGVNNLALNCLKHKVTLIHISTDYVFDGSASIPYKENDKTNPLNYYGLTKLKGEQVIQEALKHYFIIRSSWLYGKFGTNFVKTMLRLAKTKTEIKVINDQFGSPTNATDLANFILYLITTKNDKYGINHFSNIGETSWYGFVKEIFNQLDIQTKILPISSEEYPTKAKRPSYSVLDLDKVQKTTSFNLRCWERAVKEYIKYHI